MKEVITPKSYREDKIRQFETTRDWITKNFETFWKLAEEAKIIQPNEPFRIETLHGDWSFNPSLKLPHVVNRIALLLSQ